MTRNLGGYCDVCANELDEVGNCAMCNDEDTGYVPGSGISHWDSDEPETDEEPTNA